MLALYILGSWAYNESVDFLDHNIFNIGNCAMWFLSKIWFVQHIAAKPNFISLHLWVGEIPSFLNQNPFTCYQNNFEAQIVYI